MASRTLTQFQTEVKLILGDMDSSHPMDSNGLITLAINRAANDMVRRAIGGNAQNVNLFPELRNTWTVGATTVSENTENRPSDSIIITKVTSADSSSLPTWENTEERPLGGPIDPYSIGLMNKATTDARYPQLWGRKAKKIIYHPTTRTGYTTYLRFYGLARLTPLSSGSETFPTEEDFDEVIATLAAAKVARSLGWKERHEELLISAKDLLMETIGVTTLGEEENDVGAEDMPTRSDVYGAF